MNLTKDKLLCLWNNREQIFKDKKNAEIIERFNAVRELFEEVETKEITYDENLDEVKIDEVVLKKNDGDSPSLEYFGSAEDGWIGGNENGGGRGNIKQQMNLFPKYEDFIRKFCCVLTRIYRTNTEGSLKPGRKKDFLSTLNFVVPRKQKQKRLRKKKEHA